MFDTLKDTTKKLIKAFNPADFVREAGSPLVSALKDPAKDILETGQNIIAQSKRSAERSDKFLDIEGLSKGEIATRGFGEGAFTVVNTIGEAFVGLGKVLLPETAEKIIAKKFEDVLTGVAESDVAQKAYTAGKNYFESKTERTQANLFTAGLFGATVSEFITRGKGKKFLNTLQKTSDKKVIEDILVKEFNVDADVSKKYINNIAKTKDKGGVKKNVTDAMFEGQARLDAKNRGIDLPETSTIDEFNEVLRKVEEPTIVSPKRAETSLTEVNGGQLEGVKVSPTKPSRESTDLPDPKDIEVPVVKSIDDELSSLVDNIEKGADIPAIKLTPELTRDSVSKSIKEVLATKPTQRVSVYNRLPVEVKQVIDDTIQKGDVNVSVVKALENKPVKFVSRETSKSKKGSSKSQTTKTDPQQTDTHAADSISSPISSKNVSYKQKVADKNKKSKKISKARQRANEGVLEGYEISDEYKVAHMDSEIEKAVELVKKDKDEALEIALGNKESSDNLMMAVNFVMKEKAIEEGNWALVNKLLTKAYNEGTRFGQEINMMKANINQNPHERYIKSIVEARMSDMKLGDPKIRAEKLEKMKTQLKRHVKREVKAKYKKASAANAFLDSITC